MLTFNLNEELELFKKLGKPIKKDCGSGITMDYIEFSEQDLTTFIKRIETIVMGNQLNLLDWFNRSVIGYPDEKQRFMVKIEKIKIEEKIT